jgi:hypothetical protein
MKIKLNKLEDIIKKIKKTAIKEVYIDIENIPQQFKVKIKPEKEGEEPKDGLATRMMVILKLTATDDKQYLIYIETISQKELLEEKDLTSMNEEVNKRYDVVIRELQDKLPSCEIISGIIEGGI